MAVAEGEEVKERVLEDDALLDTDIVTDDVAAAEGEGVEVMVWVGVMLGVVV